MRRRLETALFRRVMHRAAMILVWFLATLLVFQVFVMLKRLMRHPLYHMRNFFVAGLPEIDALRYIVNVVLRTCVYLRGSCKCNA